MNRTKQRREAYVKKLNAAIRRRVRRGEYVYQLAEHTGLAPVLISSMTHFSGEEK